jgi:hypothetical protein
MNKLLLICLLGLLASGCTENARTRNFGGSSTQNLPVGQKLVNVTWKSVDLWVLTRPMREGEVAENSSFGVMQGKIIFVETK